jgi:bifunctional non-homologous end joining protein LigD
MLATLVREPFHRPGWTYEEKYDGFRLLAYKEGRHVRLLSRNDIDRTAGYPDVAQAVGRLPARTLLLDGELVAFDRRGVSRFQLLQKGTAPRAYEVFDCLYDDGRDLRRAPLAARREALEAAVPAAGGIVQCARRLGSNGLAAYRTARRRGLEGVIAKDEGAPYEEKRSNKWLKVKVRQEEEFVIGGFTAPRGARTRFGALLLGAYDARRRLRYVGKVGTGFTQETLNSLYGKLKPLIRETAPFVDPPRERNATFVSPKLVAEIAFEEWTADWKLRQPAYLGVRDDKKATDVLHPEAAP